MAGVPVTGDRHPITYRHPDLIRGVLGYIIDTEADEQRGPAFAEVVEAFDGQGHTGETVETMLYELQSFGAIRRTGRYKRGDDSRRVLITALGRHWLDGTQPDPIGGTP